MLAHQITKFMNIKKILLVILVLVVIGAAYGYYQYTRGNKDLSGAKADVSISAVDLYNEYSADEKIANTKYLSKVISVRGKISKIDKDATGSASIMLDAGSDMGGVSCLLDTRHNDEAAKLHNGDSVLINGSCTGMLSDVVLVRCSVQ